MGIAPTLLESSFSTSSGPWTSGTIAPAGPAVTVKVAVTEFGGGTAPSSVAVTGCGLTWTLDDSIDNAAALASCWLFHGTGTPSSGTLTITPTGGSSIKEANWSIVDWAGVDPAAPIVQTTHGTAASTNPQTINLTLGALGDAANNATVMATAGGSTAAPGGGYTELSDLMNNVGLEAQWKLPGSTTPSCTGDSAFFGQAAIAFEIKAAALVAGAGLAPNRIYATKPFGAGGLRA